jgi:hypothetical protein
MQKGKGKGKWTIGDEFREQKEESAKAAAHEAALYPRIGIVNTNRMQYDAANTSSGASSSKDGGLGGAARTPHVFPPNSLYIGTGARPTRDPRWEAEADDTPFGIEPEGDVADDPDEINYEDFIPDSPTHKNTDVRDDPEPALDASLNARPLPPKTPSAPVAGVEFTVADSALAEYIIGETWHRIAPARVDFVKHHDSVRRANAYLSGLKSEQPLIIGLPLLRTLSTMGLVAQHIENEIARTSAGAEFVLCRCLVQHLSEEDDPELCLLLFLTFRPATGPEADRLVTAYKSRARVTLETSEMDIAASGKTAAELRAEAAAPEDLTTELGQMRHVQKEMMRQLLLPATLANYFFDLRRVKESEKKYTLDLLNAV